MNDYKVLKRKTVKNEETLLLYVSTKIAGVLPERPGQTVSLEEMSMADYAVNATEGKIVKSRSSGPEDFVEAVIKSLGGKVIR